MRKAISLALSIALALGLASSCGCKKEKNELAPRGPERTAINFIEELNKGNPSSLCSYLYNSIDYVIEDISKIQKLDLSNLVITHVDYSEGYMGPPGYEAPEGLSPEEIMKDQERVLKTVKTCDVTFSKKDDKNFYFSVHLANYDGDWKVNGWGYDESYFD